MTSFWFYTLAKQCIIVRLHVCSFFFFIMFFKKRFNDKSLWIGHSLSHCNDLLLCCGPAVKCFFSSCQFFNAGVAQVATLKISSKGMNLVPQWVELEILWALGLSSDFITETDDTFCGCADRILVKWIDNCLGQIHSLCSFIQHVFLSQCLCSMNFYSGPFVNTAKPWTRRLKVIDLFGIRAQHPNSKKFNLLYRIDVAYYINLSNTTNTAGRV